MSFHGNGQHQGNTGSDLAEAPKPEECANSDWQFFLHEHLHRAVLRSATALRNCVAHRGLLDD